jgi:hypothetical protein
LSYATNYITIHPEYTPNTHFVKSQSLGIGLKRLFIILLSFLNKSEYMPTDVGCKIVSNALFDQLDAFFPLP